ncbi:SIMPL domain-containing protein [Aestuariivivens sediminicola]|uniref:SIMPL domain-containing protein n=1 Tax=Aestuariivivens sediminicola TaxID=2913560 RepID=UPI001F57535F|nr:SIMPL domain-containing protein [Aestuariivivens sediminicola]
MKKTISAIVFSLAIIIAAFLLGNAVKNRNKTNGTIAVTGLGNADFTSDLIVWEGSFTRENTALKNAYNDLEQDKNIISDYLIQKGINEDEFVFNAVNSRKNTKAKYAQNGKYIEDVFLGYILTQSIKIESKDVAKVERIAREITELLNKGIQFYSQPPRYYYTQLADLKIEMISKASADAKSRAEKIAEHSGAQLGDVLSAKMGVFQITGQNSNEGYSWGGTYNTSSKEKTASITMKLVYEVD